MQQLEELKAALENELQQVYWERDALGTELEQVGGKQPGIWGGVHWWVGGAGGGWVGGQVGGTGRACVVWGKAGLVSRVAGVGERGVAGAQAAKRCRR